MPQTQAWSTDNWQWDPYKLVAASTDEKAALQRKTLEAGTEVSSSGSPTSSGDQQAKAAGKSRGPPTCQVDGCLTDLTGLKEYHIRYKICEHHLKIPSIIREGVRQRFCQQCGRFHDLGEFDGDKRSCRARLQRHNARRRKKGDPEPTKAPRRTNRQTKDVSYSAASRSASPPSDDAKASSGSPKSTAHVPQSAPQQPWQQMDMQAEAQPQDWGACSNTTSMALESAFSDFLKQENAQMLDGRTGVPSLPQDHNQSTLSQQMVIDDMLASCHPSDAHSSDTMDMQFLPDMLSGSPQQPDYMQQAGMQGEDPHTGPLFMMHQQALQAARQAGYARAMQQQQQQQPQQQLSSWSRAPDLAPQNMDLGMDDFPNMYFPASPEQQQRQQRGLLSVPQQMPDATKADSLKVPEIKQEICSSQPSEVLSQAQDLLAFNHSQPKYIPEEHFTRMSAKLFNCTPEHLPPDLKQNLIGLLSCGVNSIEGYIMPGCLQLTVDACVSGEQLEAMQGMSGRQAVEQLLQGQNKAFWSSDAMLVQWQDELVIVKEGKVQHVVTGTDSSGILPHIQSMTPLCLFNAHMGSVSITGRNISGEGHTVLCRSQGSYVPVKVSPSDREGLSSLRQEVKLQLPTGLRQGSVQVEVARGGFISQAQPVLVLANEQAVAEVLQLSGWPVPGLDVNALLRDMDRVLEFSNDKQAEAINSPHCTTTRHYSAEESKSIASLACGLLGFACKVGWVAVSELLLPIVTAVGTSISDLVTDLENIADEGMTLLHHAVRSQNAALVSLLLVWGINNGHTWDCSAAGPGGLTPLHLAALLGDGGRVADVLTDACGEALSSWSSVQAADGSTAADFAARTGAQDINAMIQRKLDGQPSGLEAESYQFDPDTGELIDSDVTEAQISPQAWSPSEKKAEPIMTPQVPSQVHRRAIKAVIKQHHAPIENHHQYSSNGSGSDIVESPEDLFSPCSNAYETPSFAKHLADEAFYEEVPADATLEGSHDQKMFNHDDQMYLEQKVCNSKDVPRVFDLHAAMLSSAVVGAVGMAALGLRFCLEYFGV